jgi:hypothetical protein
MVLSHLEHLHIGIEWTSYLIAKMGSVAGSPDMAHIHYSLKGRFGTLKPFIALKSLEVNPRILLGP